MNATCTDNDGSYECVCKSGYTGDGWNCTEFDECTLSPCDASANCTDTYGSYECSCLEGYTGDGWNCSGNNTKITVHLFITYCLVK